MAIFAIIFGIFVHLQHLIFGHPIVRPVTVMAFPGWDGKFLISGVKESNHA